MERVEPPLDERLSEVIHIFEEEHISYWSDHPEVSKAWVQLVTTLAEVLVTQSEDMDRVDSIRHSHDGRSIEYRFESKGGMATLFDFPEGKEQIQLVLAEHFCTDTESMAERCLEISSLALAADPEKAAVSAYLQRLGRCYITGLFPECAILCRAVLEKTLEEVYSRTEQQRPESEDGRTSLSQDIETAHQIYHWLSDEAYEAADKVRIRGNAAVHSSPDASGAVLETIRMTMVAVEELYAVAGE